MVSIAKGESPVLNRVRETKFALETKTDCKSNTSVPKDASSSKSPVKETQKSAGSFANPGYLRPTREGRI